jgi:hypothetical protein
MPSSINTFARMLIVKVVHAITFRGVVKMLLRLALTHFIKAITIVIGVMKRNQKKKASSMFSCGQNGMLRSIGNEIKNNSKPSKDGRHQRITERNLWVFGEFGSGASIGSTV